jgi:CarD family transcriptional regulator
MARNPRKTIRRSPVGGGMKMFQINEYVVYSNLGICQIREVRPARLGGAEPVCYVLKPLANPTSILYVPIDSEALLARIRPVLTRTEILALIEDMPAAEALGSRDERERSRDFMARVQSGDCRELIRVVRTLHLEKARKREHGKGLTTTDAKLMAQAENLLYDEFAFALGIDREAVVPFIQDHPRVQARSSISAASPGTWVRT